MLIWCSSRNIYYFTIHFCRIVWWKGSSKEQRLFKKSCNIINVFTVTFDQFNASLLNKSIVLSKNKIILASNLWIFHISICFQVALLVCLLENGARQELQGPPWETGASGEALQGPPERTQRPEPKTPGPSGPSERSGGRRYRASWPSAPGA